MTDDVADPTAPAKRRGETKENTSAMTKKRNDGATTSTSQTNEKNEPYRSVPPPTSLRHILSIIDIYSTLTNRYCVKSEKVKGRRFLLHPPASKTFADHPSI